MHKRLTLAVMAGLLAIACGQVSPGSLDSEFQSTELALTGFTGPMTNSHSVPALTLLGDGRALMVDYISETYNPATNGWTATPARTPVRHYSVVVSLADGRALAIGGEGGSPYTRFANAELFTPQTNTWSATGAMNQPRGRPVATRLADGRVLVVGGFNPSNVATRSAETFDPATGAWTALPNEANYSYYSDCSITLLADGRVLLVGFYGAEVFNPATNLFTKVGTSANGRYDHLAERLPNGRVLLAGGSRTTSELFDPVLLQFTTTGAMLVNNRHFAASTVLADGTVLAAGGHDGVATTFGSVERYQPGTGTWSQAPALAQKRHQAKMVQLASGEVLVVGGSYRIGAYSDMSINGPQAAELLTGSCVPQSCAAQGKTCGTVSDGCGGTLACGTCGAGEACSATNVCVCSPTTCAAQGKTCGSIPDGCGNTLACGTCGAGEACSATNVCVCSPTTCAAQGKTCGSIPDGCGNTLECGTCGAGEVCATNNVCVCVPINTCTEQGRACGPVSDGCGGTLSCGVCGAGEACDPGPGACVIVPEGHALYDATLGAPVCATLSSSCDSDSLLVGRDALGPEPHAPNTLTTSACADGTAGVFHVDPSLDRLVVKTLDGGPFQPGKTVQVDVTLWNASSSTRVDLFSAASASSPNWIFVGSLVPGPAVGLQVLSTTHVLRVGNRQVLRGIVRDDSEGPYSVSCAAAPSSDHDDLVFQVDSAEDTTPPIVAITAPVMDTVGAQYQPVNLQVGATDNVAVQRVDFYIQNNPPNGALTPLTVDTSAPYTATYVHPYPTPTSFRVVARAYDFSGNQSEASRTFAIDNTPPSVAITSHANNATVSGTVSLVASAQDAFGITQVSFYLDGLFLGIAQGPPYTLSWNTASSTVGAHLLYARATDGLGNLGVSTLITVNVAPPGPVSAVHDTSWKTPVCLGAAGSGCDSGTLLTGRANLGPEPHAPNTLYGGCADGTYGSFHSDESVDRLVISTVDGGALRSGTSVKVTATVWAYSTSDVLDIYSAPNASAPVWTFVGTVTPQSSGPLDLSVTFPLPTSTAGVPQAVRAVFRYGGTRSACSSGLYDDMDDLVFSAP
ncbi:hypothetical protein D7Y13_04230 [Corallococcus praedator]|uniref:Kelch-like protein n=1 Tax=Corallococcus praedator TaxID=2316724 RepID=A0ABX9QQ57_9BACT|nr:MULTISPECIES: Ig-like domain-containing protein [Corallococcus]RKH34975.1 hypothetical protein D7X75_06015 [Corallococcus sp. CA031C]RKI15442.1 hypothetical protein D7Y13_04230 [Corallococcus praedator]